MRHQKIGGKINNRLLRSGLLYSGDVGNKPRPDQMWGIIAVCYSYLIRFWHGAGQVMQNKNNNKTIGE